MIDEDPIGTRPRGFPNSPRQISGISTHEQKRDMDTRLFTPASRTNQLLDRGEKLVGSRSVSQTAVPFIAARQRYRKDVH